MARVLFTHSYFMRLDPKQWKQMQPYAPLATITAAALAREKGHEVALFDTMFSNSPAEIETEIINYKPDWLVIYDDGFNYLTKMCLTNMREAAFEMIKFGKQHGCRVILSGSDATDHYQKYLEKGADFVIFGEAEQTILELIDNADSGKKVVEKINGIMYLFDNIPVKTNPRPVMQDLDILSIAAWDLIDLQEYRKRWIQKNGYFSVNIATTRGCPYKCNWCAKPIYGNRYNVRSAQHVIQELKYIQTMIKYDHVWFCDDIFGLKPGWIQEFGNFLAESELKIRFKIQTRVDLVLKTGVLEALHHAGCEILWMGVESGSQKILDAMDKGITLAQVYEATAKIKELGMKPAFFLQFGYPGEDLDDVKATIKMLMDLMPADIGISVSYPLPGTKFYENVKQELSAKANWKDSDELVIMFKNKYRPGYYKSLQRFVHKKFRKKQGFLAFYSILSKGNNREPRSLYKMASLIWYVPVTWLAGLGLKFQER